MKNTQNKSYFFIGYEIKNIFSLIPLFKSSIKYQIDFIQELEQKLRNFICESQDDIDRYLLQMNNFMVVLPSIIGQLGIPFAHNFLDTDFLYNLIDWYFDEEKTSVKKKEKIKNIFDAYMDVFKFVLSNDKLNNIRESLASFGLIEKKEEIKDKDAKDDEKIYENYYALLNGLKTLKEIGIDKEKIVELEKKYDELKKEIKIYKYKISSKNENGLEKNNHNEMAEIEFFERLIKDLDNYFIELKKSQGKNYDNNIIEKNEIFEEKNEIEKNMPPLNERTSLYLDEKLKERKNEFIEFKSYSFPLAKENMEDIKRQICGFLNSRGGRLYIGINGENRVKGVALNSKSRDNWRNSIINLTYDFYPNCRIDKVTVDFIPVKDRKTDKFINRRYVVKIRIFPGEPELLYSMTSVGYNSTIRKNMQVYELNSTEIYKEIVERDDKKNKKNDNNINKELYIKDPPPEINMNEDDDENRDENGFPFFGNVNNFNKNNNLNNNNNNNFNNNNKNKKNKGPAKPPGKKGKKSYMVREGDITVQVTNIDIDVPINEVNGHFKDCKCSSQKMFKGKGYGYLNFSNENDARDCIARHNGDQLGKKKIKLTIVDN